MRRCFLPIGQGAFYCERFFLEEGKSLNVVFDCGALPASGMRRCLKDVLPAALGGDNTIHLMFLSHLHEDHVNGVEELRNKYNITIKEIRYPAINPDEQLLMKYWFLSNGQQNGLAYALCMDHPRGTGYARLQGTNLIPIPSTPSPEEPENGADNSNSNSNILKLSDLVVSSGIVANADIENMFPEWEFRTFNYLKAKERQELKDKLAVILPPGENVTNENLDKQWRKPSGKKAIKDAYAEIPGGFNANSMTVFSGPVTGDWEHWHQMLECCHKPPCHMNAELAPTKPGCLYTGDYDASSDERWKALSDRYSDCWERIGCLQIPHHGACLNFNKAFLELDAIFVASAGAHNRFGHPNACVQLAFQQKNKHLFCVTENLKSCLCTSVSFSLYFVAQ